MSFSSLKIRISLMSVLKNSLKNDIINKYTAVLNSNDIYTFTNAYAELCSKLYMMKNPCADIVNALSCDQNPLTDNLNAKNDVILKSADNDLQTISDILKLKTEDFYNYMKQSFNYSDISKDDFPELPIIESLPFKSSYELLEYYRKNGYGFFAKSQFFTVNSTGDIITVLCPDMTKLSDLKGYERQRNQVISNTLAFINKKPANNILLYGDKGTGKSSTVKAVANEFAAMGLKIVELSPANIQSFPKICELASKSPYRIIVFMDDLSFDKEYSNFSILKAFIEGGLTLKPENMLVYATSNRRHLVRESFSDRQGDDIHVRDTLETVTSLSDRFGLEITFSVPDKDEYLFIVNELAQTYGVQAENLDLLAERFAIRRNGRSPRTAQQFIRHMLTSSQNT